MRYLKSISTIIIFCTIFIWTNCDQSTNVKNNTPPPDSQTQENKTLTKANKEDPRLVPGRYIVTYKNQGERSISEQAATEAVQRTNAIFSELNIDPDSLIHQYKYALKGFAGNLTKKQVEALKKDNRVESIVQDIKYKAIQMMNTSSSNKPSTKLMSQTTPWGITRVGGPLDGSGKKAWVLDTGIDLDHPDLDVDVSSSVAFVAGENADDGHGHGSHVAGTIAAKDNSTGVVGVAADASVVAVKVCDSGGYCYTSDLDAGIDYIVSNYSSGDVANISLGWPVTGSPYVDLPLSILESTIETAADDGLKFAIAAGNEDQDANNKSPARVEYNNVWTVSAHDDNDNFASFSNYGNPPIEYSNPGVDIHSLWRNGGTNTIDGTSMATPHIAGLLLALGDVYTDGTVSNDPDSSPDEIATGTAAAPSISGNVTSSDFARITWSSVPFASQYKVYRRYENGYWSERSTTTGTSYNDTQLMDPDLQVLSVPPGDNEDYYTYKVHAITPSGTISEASNHVYFAIEENCHPPVCS
ncbi:S8 family serine peptidase [Gracilimonas sp. BCB1]|uniref:S8 family serine peptidase n=1 Tax=Gracilimonas sp. BCB1 TaxID=3152362 RepID=UPI0032D96FC7